MTREKTTTTIISVGMLLFAGLARCQEDQNKYSDAIEGAKYAKHYQPIGDVISEENRLKEQETNSLTPRFYSEHTDYVIGQPVQDVFDYTQSRKIIKEVKNQVGNLQLDENRVRPANPESSSPLLAPARVAVAGGQGVADEEGVFPALPPPVFHQGVARLSSYPSAAATALYPPTASLYPPPPANAALFPAINAFGGGGVGQISFPQISVTSSYSILF